MTTMKRKQKFCSGCQFTLITSLDFHHQNKCRRKKILRKFHTSFSNYFVVSRRQSRFLDLNFKFKIQTLSAFEPKFPNDKIAIASSDSRTLKKHPFEVTRNEFTFSAEKKQNRMLQQQFSVCVVPCAKQNTV